jgi:hypothetical protein
MTNEEAFRTIQVLFDLILNRDKEIYKQHELILALISNKEELLLNQIKQQMFQINALQERLSQLGQEIY